ncbi:HlyD family type I secretion periplasmic adaptor subunit [Reyranella sp. CPCC 100927]|uniref:HlyD family type I secretion periplasmic adaptor subunit n=1 Tax=Reyranella sp. CPCC 100927 TaxID=2599616 RepID=UPI0011B494F7|nr:HlyD family type I secretion periplasmic adaptor subunit [Reyranella sp. CPCC 100927]TWT10028.1 HlyD family type I secretion periplasmic adaptor subunit [Reyranella sp. CPCC 100927]
MSGAETHIEVQGVAPAIGVRRPLLFAMALFIAFAGGFGAWSSLAPLESAAIAPGVVVVDTNRKAVQHLEGGVVSQLLAREGETVSTGQLLVLLDQTQARSTVDRLRAQLLASLALQARLRTERDQVADIVFPPELIATSGDSTVADLIRAERHVFETRRGQIEGQIRILRQRNAQVDEEIRGLVDEIRAEDVQLKLIREEMADVEALVTRGLERKPRLLALQRQAASIEGLRAQNVARIARNRQAIGENDMRVLDLQAQYLSESVQKLRDEEARIVETREKLRAAEDVLQRTEIRAPVAGRVQSLKVFTVGGVVPPRETIMEIVPADERLIVEARMSTADIDKMQAGLPVQLRFTAFNQRSTPSLDGKVLSVSADRMNEPQSGVAFYLLRITVEQGASSPGGLNLYPGMPVEVTVKTGSQTVLAYLTKPLRDSMHRALREH